jgi:hypothetical protein
MEFKESEASDGKLWLLCAGACAVALSFFVYQVDEYMTGAAARDRAHNERLAELRGAQAGLKVAHTDHRQTVELKLEGATVPLPADVVSGAHHSGAAHSASGHESSHNDSPHH